MQRVGFFVAGPNGTNLFSAIHREVEVAFACTYPQAGADDDTVARLCAEHGYALYGRNDEPAVDASVSLIFVAGWQYLFRGFDERYVVFHDSLLPRYRGFAPTVGALIAGERYIGVSAFQMADATDAGPLYAQHVVEVTYPCRLRMAHQLLRDAYAACARDVLAASERGKLTGVPQDESAVTYSIWRDAQDMRIDWHWDAERIVRFVDALSAPYSGAKTSYRDREIVVDAAEELPEVRFEERHPGKIWSIENGMASVVCGRGMLRIVRARDLDGAAVELRALRERLR